jgi:hypothetical protein
LQTDTNTAEGYAVFAFKVEDEFKHIHIKALVRDQKSDASNYFYTLLIG